MGYKSFFGVCLGQYGFINDFLGLFGPVWVINDFWVCLGQYGFINDFLGFVICKFDSQF